MRVGRGGALTRVTVQIPSYARAQWLGETIASALAQTFTDLVVEVHDDATPDDSVERVVAQFDDPRLKYIRYADNAGIVGNFTRSLLGADDRVRDPARRRRRRRADAGGADGRRAGPLPERRDGALALRADRRRGRRAGGRRGLARHAVAAARAGARRSSSSSMLHGSRVCTLDGADPALGGAGGRVPASATIRRSTSSSGCGWPKTWDIAWLDEVLCALPRPPAQLHLRARRRHRPRLHAGRADDARGAPGQASQQRRRAARLARAARRPRAARARWSTACASGRCPTGASGRRSAGSGARRGASRRCCASRTAWALLAGSVVGQRWVDRLKGRA